MELLVLVDNNTYIDVDAAGEPGTVFIWKTESRASL